MLTAELRCALEIVVSSMGPQPGSGEMVQQMAERDMLVTIQGTSDLASALSQASEQRGEQGGGGVA